MKVLKRKDISIFNQVESTIQDGKKEEICIFQTEC